MSVALIGSGGSGNGGAVSQVSEAGGEFSEGDADTIMGRYVNGEFVVAAAQVLYETRARPRCSTLSACV
jgi:hypothetical protein